MTRQPAFPMGGPFNSHAVVLVVRSEHQEFKAGDHVTNAAGFRASALFVLMPNTHTHGLSTQHIKSTLY